MSSTIPSSASGGAGQKSATVGGSNSAVYTLAADPSQGNSRGKAPAGRMPRVRVAGAGDHPSTHQLLVSVFQEPSAAEFYAQQEDPLYEPSDRLVVKSGHQIISHLRLTQREMLFGELVLPVAGMWDVATLPEFRGRGYATELLEAADRKMQQDGAIMGLLRTKIPKFYARRGWTVCGRHCFSTSAPRDILSYLSAAEMDQARHLDARLANLIQLDGARPQMNIRLWRHVERGALMRLYRGNTQGSYGALVRNDAYWRWLISRRGYDRIYVAIEGPNKLELDDAMVPIVGYAAMKEGRIAELMTVPDHPRAASQLLARACGDAIERDYHTVRLDAPPGHPLHQTIELAGGRFRYEEVAGGEVFMVKLFDPLALLKMLLPQIHQRAKAAELARPCELGIRYDGEKLRLVVSRRGVKLAAGKLGRSYLKCNRGILTQLLLGHLKAKAAAECGRLEASTQVAAETASVLFPPLPFWRPPLDDLPA